MSMASQTAADTVPLQYVKGIGPQRARVLASEGIVTPDDVLRLVPRGYIDRSLVGSMRDIAVRLQAQSEWLESPGNIPASVSSESSVLVTVDHVSERPLRGGRSMLTASVADQMGGQAQLVFWNAIGYYRTLLKVGERFLVSGMPEFNDRFGRLTFTHPELDRVDDDDIERMKQGAVLSMYPMSQRMKSAGITMRMLRSLVNSALELLQNSVIEVLPNEILERHHLMQRSEAIRKIHCPESMAEATEAWRRLKYEEFFLFQIMLAQRQGTLKRSEPGIVMHPKSPRARALMERLPYALTSAQRRVINEIIADVKQGIPMHRLLQGDVGSGKTIVALLCMLNAVDNGYQTALMVPTEILAEQHYRNFIRLLDGLDVSVELLVGAQGKKVRRTVEDKVQTGQAHIIVGTHALFDGNISYNNLGLVVIDEQHRFGVAQRAELQRLGRISHAGHQLWPHVLVMSATPIPRTLAMTVYGDLDTSVIDELPQHRKPIKTKVVFESQIKQAYDFIREHVRDGRQAYIVFPLVEKSEKLEVKSAVEHYEYFQKSVFPDLTVGLLHGRMTAAEKDVVMTEFLEARTKVLVATTVIEVGVDVPNATVMLIENAERFGLAQLHQLRGRVGRGADQSYCLLATKDHYRYHLKSADAGVERAKSIARLRTMEETTNGFTIAEVDLNLRGPGDVMGTRQSGIPEFAYANIVSDGDLLTLARSDAFAVVADDPELVQPNHAALRRHVMAQLSGQNSVHIA